MTTISEQLQELLNQMGFKTPLDQIQPTDHNSFLSFLKMERDYRQKYRLERLMASCGIRKPQIRTFEQFDWSFNSKTPKQDILAFRNENWIEEPANLLLIGDTGLGKSHLAKAFCYDAILKGFSAYFITVFDLITRIKKAPHPEAKIDYYGKSVKVLCLDELGYTFHHKDDADLIFQIVSKRSESLPTIVTTNLPPKQWGSILSGPTASAILDRLSYNGKFIALEGNSYRLKRKKR